MNYSTKNKSNLVAVVIPFYKKKPTPDEEISFRHLMHFLSKYDRYIIAPEGLQIDYPGFRIKLFDDKFFQGVASYSKLLLSRSFYEAFLGYKYILIYQLDCLVFSDQLWQWCKMDFDYIGAPWLKSKSNPNRGFSRVGNGGLSLRKIKTFFKVIESKRYVEEKVSYWKDIFFTPLDDVYNLNLLKRLGVFREARGGVERYLRHYTLNEDRFWSDRARLFYPDFKIAPVGSGLRFSFDAAPEYCFKSNNYQLPFGCHGWLGQNKAFWEPYLLK